MSVFKKLVKLPLGLIGFLWRSISQTQQSHRSVLVGVIARDLLRAYLAKNPNTIPTLYAVRFLVMELVRLTGLEQTTALRVFEAAYQEVITELETQQQIRRMNESAKDASNANN